MKAKTKSKPRVKPRVRKSPFRGMLPNGEYCGSEQEYADAWMEMSNYLEAELPGLKLYGIDPGISFHWKGTVIDLPRSFALALVERLKTGKAAPVITPEKVPQALNKDFWGTFRQMIEAPQR